MPIRNMNRAIKFYTKSLGGRVKLRDEGDMKNFWAWLKLGANDVWLIAPEKREKRALAYTTFVVKNIKSTVNGLKRKGVRFEKAEKIGPDSKVEGSISYDSTGAAAYFKDTEGNLLMVWQNGPGM